MNMITSSPVPPVESVSSALATRSGSRSTSSSERYPSPSWLAEPPTTRNASQTPRVQRRIYPPLPSTASDAVWTALLATRSIPAQSSMGEDRMDYEMDSGGTEKGQQRKRRWPAEVPREIRDRILEILDELNGPKEYQMMIKDAWVTNQAMKRLLSRTELEGLDARTWIDDSVIAFYGVLINNRYTNSLRAAPDGDAVGGGGGGKLKAKEARLKKAWCFNSHFWKIFTSQGYERVKQWTNKFDAFEKDILIIPINIRDIHWTCAAINLRLKRFEYYDSTGTRNDSIYTGMRKWVQEEHRCKKGGPIDLSDWKDYWDPNVPQQSNGNDCGVFTCCFMESLSREGEGFDFSQAQMPYLRQKIAYEIDKGELFAEEFE